MHTFAVRTAANPSPEVASRPRAGHRPIVPAPAWYAGGVSLPGCARLRAKSDLHVGNSEDPEEREADAAAEAVLGGGTSAPCACGGGCPSCRGGGKSSVARLLAKHDDGAPVGRGAATIPRSVADALASPGRPLDGATRGFMESRFGHDFARVRVRDDDRSTRDIGARAYAVGSDLVFAPGRYAPETSDGRRLLAHELAHVVQQGRTPPTLRRQEAGPTAPSTKTDPTADPAPKDAGAPAGAPPQAPPPAAPDTPDSPAPAPMTETDPVRRIVVSCAKHIIAFESSGPPLIYQLQTCHIPTGHYAASVSDTDKGVILTLSVPGQPKGTLLFNTSYIIKKGQVNPSTLLQAQKSVTVDVVDSIVPTEVDDEEAPECQISFDSQDLIDADGFSTKLFPDQSLDHTIWKHRFLLGELGWFTVEAKAAGKATGTFSGSYGPGALSDICLFSVLPGGKFGGTAVFRIPGHLAAEVVLDGSLSLTGTYLSIIDVAEAEGKINVTARAQADAAILSALAVIYDPGATKPWSFKVDTNLSASASLQFSITTSVVVKLLGQPVWEEDWNPVNARVDADWTGGLLIKPDLSIVLQPGTMAIAGQDDTDLSAAAATGGGSKAGGGKKGGSKAGGTAAKIGKVVLKVLDTMLDPDRSATQADDQDNPVVKLPPTRRTSDSPTGSDAIDDQTMLEEVRTARIQNSHLDLKGFKRNYAVFKVLYKGALEYRVDNNDEKALHSESKVIGQLQARDRTFKDTKIVAIYTEREPCAGCASDLAFIRRTLGQDFPIFFTVSQATPLDQRASLLRSRYIPASKSPGSGSPGSDTPDAGP